MAGGVDAAWEAAGTVLPTTELASALAALFPASVGTALGPVDDEPPCPHPAERAAIATAAGVRRREFLAGRACAHVALGAIGAEKGVAVGRGVAREPLWPAGVVGSISHGGGLAGAVAARSADAWGLGLDIEALEPPLDAALERVVLASTERSRPVGPEPLGVYRSKVAFSVKECVHKCLFPRTRWALDPADVTVEVDLEGRRYEAVVDGSLRLAEHALPPLHGRFALVAGLLLTGLWVGPQGPRHGVSRSGPRNR